MIIDYEFFYDISEYGNKNWNGSYTQKEVACNAYNYLVDFEYSKAKGGHISSTIQELLRLLDEDGSVECCFWSSKIRNELGLCQTRII